MEWIIENWQHIIAIVGGVVMLVRLIVKLTPNPKFGTTWEKIVEVLKAIGLHVEDTK